MRSKRILLTALSIAFVIITIVSIFMMFKIKKVEVEFSVYTDTSETATLQEKFNEYTGDNLIFLDTDSVKKKIDVGPCFEIVSVKKSYPNVLKVSVSERRARYVVTANGEDYVVSDEGYVLYTAKGDESLIKVNLSGITLNSVSIGSKLSSDHDEDLYNAFSLANVDGVVDASSEMTIEYVGRTLRSVIFLTKTDVKIRIPMAVEYGVEKTQTVFNAYFNEDRDYIKSYNEIRVDIQPDGTLKVVWVQQ